MRMKNQPNKNHIFFRNLVVLSSIGIHDIEKEKPQRVIINAKLILDSNHQIRSDLISETLDYDIIRDKIVAIASSHHFNLQETLCEEIAQYCLSKKSVTAVEVSTEKPDIYDNCDGVGLKIYREK